MRVLFVIFILVPLLSEANELSDGLWLEIDRETNCRFLLEFRDTGDYFVLNECHENRETGIKETGRYVYGEGKLELSSRMIMSEISMFKSKSEELVAGIELEEKNLVVSHNGNTSKFVLMSIAH